MKLSSALLCDVATIREGLLHLLGGGLNVLYRESYPASMQATLALMLEGAESDFRPAEAASILIQIHHGDAGGKVVGAIEGEIVAGPREDPGPYFITPLVFDLTPVRLAEPGSYVITAQLNENEPLVLNFDSVQVPVNTGPPLGLDN